MFNLRQRQFIKEYLKGEASSAECARKVGYAPKHARSTAYKILHNSEGQKLIQHYSHSLDIQAMSCIAKGLEKTKEVMDNPNISIANLTNFFKLYYLILENSKKYEN